MLEIRDKSFYHTIRKKSCPHKLGKLVVIKMDLGDIAWNLRNESKMCY